MKPAHYALGAVALCLSFVHEGRAASRPYYAAGSYTLTLEGAPAGTLRGFDGGNVVADAIVEPVGPKVVAPTKRISATRIEPIELDIALGTRPVTDWIVAALGGTAQPKNGYLSAADSSSNELSRLSFDRGRLVQIEFPVCDAASKEVDYLHLVIQPEAVRRQAGSGKVAAADPRQKSVTQGTFKLTIDGLDSTRVIKVAPLVVKVGSATEVGGSVGGQRVTYSVSSGPVSISNVQVTVAEAGAKSWQEWHEDFVVKGNVSKKKTGTLEYQTAVGAPTTIAKLSFKGLGILRFALDRPAAAGDTSRRYVADLFVEELRFEAP